MTEATATMSHMDAQTALRIEAEIGKLVAESSKLIAESNKLIAESSKLHAESAKYQRERVWYPVVLMTTAVGATAALVKLLFS